MDKQAVTAAKTALERAMKAVKELEALAGKGFSQDLHRAMQAWSDALTYGNRVFTKLEQGAKVGPTKGWFDKVKNIRSNDPLLSFMLHARNADEHGIIPVAEKQTGIANLSVPSGKPTEALLELNKDGQIVAKPGNKWTKLVKQKPSTVKLIAVRDRGIQYLVPTSHLDKPLADQSPQFLAKLFVNYLEELIQEATKRQC